MLNSTNQSRGLAVLYIICGLVLAFMGPSLVATAARLVGFLILIYAVWSLYSWFAAPVRTSWPLILGIIAGVMGLSIVINPASLISLFPTIIGVIMIFNGVLQVQKALAMKKMGFSTWLTSLIIALLLIIGGIVLLTRPMFVVRYILRICGFALVFEGIFMFWQSGYNRKLRH